MFQSQAGSRCEFIKNLYDTLVLGLSFLVKLKRFDFVELLDKLPTDIRVMVIHGQLDQVIPFSCAEVNCSPQKHFSHA